MGLESSISACGIESWFEELGKVLWKMQVGEYDLWGFMVISEMLRSLFGLLVGVCSMSKSMKVEAKIIRVSG